MMWRKHFAILSHLGPRWAMWRAGYAVRQRTGLLRRRFPTRDRVDPCLGRWLRRGIPTEPAEYMAHRTECEQSADGPKFFFPAGQPVPAARLEAVLDEAGRRRLIEVADDYCAGRFLYYSHHVEDLGTPADWMLNPFTGARHEVSTHWCDYPTFLANRGDIKDVWEPSRFAFVYWLVRAYALTGEQRYGEAFWRLVESWHQQNPSNRGPNWKCGQETALRAMATCFGLYGLRSAEATTSARVAMIVASLAEHAERIAGNIEYAVSQHNNHALSEATGLLTVGLLFPELRSAKMWANRGRNILERELVRQIYADGSYIQHSMNYHRVMLHVALWADRLASLNGQPLAAEARSRIASAGEFLFQMHDPASGRTPNYGANDGALVLPLTSCDYRDYRPTIQASLYASTGERCLPAGRWDESLLWLFGSDGYDAPVRERQPQSRQSDSGGYYTVRSDSGWCMMRCHTYRDRPVHVDPLHVDFWWQGVNWLGDSGTYRYYAPACDDAANSGLEKYFKGIAAHNTIQIDNAEPLDLVGRFLWIPWPEGRLVRATDVELEAEHYAYRRDPWRAVHRRKVKRLDAQTWIISDHVTGTGEHDVTLRWHLADELGVTPRDDGSFVLQCPAGIVQVKISAPPAFQLRLRRGVNDETGVSGWASDYYGHRVARDTLECSGRMALPVSLETRITCAPDADTDSIAAKRVQ